MHLISRSRNFSVLGYNAFIARIRRRPSPASLSPVEATTPPSPSAAPVPKSPTRPKPLRLMHSLTSPHPRLLIIDGYNVLFNYLQTGKTSQRLKEGEMEFGRMMLLQALDRLSHKYKIKTIFDGARTRVDEVVRTESHTVVFTLNRQIADDYIFTMVDRTRFPHHKVLVVTTDKELQRRVCATRGHVMPSLEFISLISLPPIIPDEEEVLPDPSA